MRGCPDRARYIVGLRVVRDSREHRREEMRCEKHTGTFATRMKVKVP